MGEWELRLAMTPRSGNAELFHSAAQRIGMEGENLRRAVGTIDDPTRLFKSGQNVVPFDDFEAFKWWLSLLLADRS